MAAPRPALTEPRSFYPALDGLRAVAVLLVFFQHYGAAHLSLFAWGWTGVDIFFVLSGFLITGILYDSQHAPHRLRDFYARRTLRIFPLYYALWLAILLLSPVAHWQWNAHWLLWPAYLGNYARFLFLHQPGNPYRFDRIPFGPSVNALFGGPMHLYIGHFWSLCVEEQFYLLWPFVVFHLRRRQTLLRLCLAAVLLSPLLRALIVFLVPRPYLALELLYRALPTRLDALLLGGLVALALRGPAHDTLRRLRRPALALTASLLVLLYLTSVHLLHLGYVGSASSWVGIFGFTLIDLFAAALILECIHPGSALARLLTLRPLRALGVISYGFYVLHDLLHDFYAWAAIQLAPHHLFPATLVFAFLGSVTLATLSYHLLEKPFLRLKRHFPHQRHTTPTD